MNRLSVKLKVTLWYTTVMIIVSGIVLLAMTSITQDMITRDMKDQLVRTVTEFTYRIGMPGGRLSIPPGNRFYEQGVHMVLFNSNGVAVDGQIPFGLEDTEFAFVDNVLRENNYDGNLYYEYDREIRLANRTSYWIKGMMSVHDESYAIRSATRNNIILTLILILVAGIGGYFIISRAFVPVNKIRKTARDIAESSDLSRRIGLGEGTDEIHALAATFDEMLDKLENTMEKEKQFTSDASHELRTPVAVILSECEYMKTCAKTVEDYVESVDSVKRQAEKMQKLISGLLTISRMDKNTLQVNFEKTDVSELVTFVCDEQAEIHNGGITLEKNIEPAIMATADRFLLARLFINLISNAYQYSHEHGTIRVSLVKEGEHVIFTVADEGIGIARADMPKIWERFYQVDGSRTANENGSMGLGLSMVKWIARCHNGRVSVKSKLGQGSTFAFVFPVDAHNKKELP